MWRKIGDVTRSQVKLHVSLSLNRYFQRFLYQHILRMPKNSTGLQQIWFRGWYVRQNFTPRLCQMVKEMFHAWYDMLHITSRILTFYEFFKHKWNFSWNFIKGTKKLEGGFKMDTNLKSSEENGIAKWRKYVTRTRRYWNMAIDILILTGNANRPQTDRMLVLQGVDTYKVLNF